MHIKLHITDKMITIMVIIEIKIIDKSKNKSLLPKMSNKKMSLKMLLKIKNGFSSSNKNKKIIP